MVRPLTPVEGCVFCDVQGNCADWERFGYFTWNGYPIYRVTPLNPVTPGHMLFVPHSHVENASEAAGLAGHVFAAASEYARQQNKPFNLITSGGEVATQTVMHLHVHYVPRHADDRLDLPWDRNPCEGCG